MYGCVLFGLGRLCVLNGYVVQVKYNITRWTASMMKCMIFYFASCLLTHNINLGEYYIN